MAPLNGNEIESKGIHNSKNLTKPSCQRVTKHDKAKATGQKVAKCSLCFFTFSSAETFFNY